MTPSTCNFSKYLIHFFLICQISAIWNEHENFSFLSRLLFRRRGGNRGTSRFPNRTANINTLRNPSSGMRFRYHRVKGNRGTPRFPTSTPAPRSPTLPPTRSPTPPPTRAPTRSPTPPITRVPTPPPTPSPTRAPTPPPTSPAVPITNSPSQSPSMNPTTSISPTITPGARLVQVGNDLTGSVESEDFGNSISLAINARRVAIGAPYGGSDANPETGAATVYQLAGNNWTVVGSPIYGVEQEDEFGETVSMSSAGTIIAISAPDNNNYLSVYEVTGDTWSKKGEDFIDANQGYLSRDGTRIAVVGIESYFLSQFNFATSNWTKISETPLDANVDAPKIAFAGIGNSIALGYPRDSTNSANAGKVTVMSYLDNGNMVQMGLDLFGTNSNDEFGYALALSNNGKVLAVGTDSANYVRVYDNVADAWVLKGEEISDTEGNFGNALGLSNNGLRIIIGQPNYNNRKGRAIVYQFENGAWVQVGDPIVGDEEEYSEGSAVSISPDGGFIATGTPEWVSNGEGIGRVRVFQIVDPPQ